MRVGRPCELLLCGLRITDQLLRKQHISHSAEALHTCTDSLGPALKTVEEMATKQESVQ